jgi:hypothetical protein
MIKNFELKNKLDGLTALANAIVKLYKYDNINVKSKFYENLGEDSFLFEIFQYQGKNKPIKTFCQIKYSKEEEPYFSLVNYDENNDIPVFIVYQLAGHNMKQYFNLDISNLDKDISNLSVDNYEIFKSANQYNL